jgi:hypothetical protein
MNDNQSAASRSGHGKNGIGIGQANDGTRFDFVVGTAVRQIQYNRLHPMTRCVTCGAKTNQNKRTCSAICTRARRDEVYVKNLISIRHQTSDKRSCDSYRIVARTRVSWSTLHQTNGGKLADASTRFPASSRQDDKGDIKITVEFAH